MLLLALGLFVFISIHLLPAKPALRDLAISKLGTGAYKGLFAVIALIGFAGIVIGKGQAPFIAVWTPPAFMAHITKLLMLPAFIFLVATYIPCNIKARLKHPMLIATKTWALAHLLANGDLASIVLFGSLLAFAVISMISAKQRGTAKEMTKQPVYMDIIVVVIGLAAYVGVAMHHMQLFGVPLF